MSKPISKIVTISNLTNYTALLFKVSLFMTILPPFTLPFFPSLINFNIIGRITFILAFCLSIILLYKTKSLKFTRWEIISFYLITFFVILGTISYINVIYVPTFLKAYEKISIGFIIYTTSLILYKVEKTSHIRGIIFTLTLAFITKLVFEFSIYFYPEFFLNAFRDFLKYETYRSIEVNLTRQRTYVDLLGESFIPLGFYYLFQLRNNIYRLASAIIVIGQVVISFLSNWRGRFINAIFVLLMVFISTYRARANNLKLILATLIVILPILFLTDKFVVSNNGFSVLDRLANKSHVEDEQPIQWRLASAEEAVLMANTHLFGVGLGNYYEHTTLKATDASLLTEEKRDLYDAAAVSGPHNLFAQYLAEGGYITLIFIITWIFYYLIQDLKVILSKKTTPEYIALSICFWGLIFGTQVYPATTLSFYVAFFALRSVLQRS